MSGHLDPEFWSEVMRESRVAVVQIARDSTESGTFDPAVVNARVNQVLARYEPVEEQAVVMHLWAQSAIGTLADTLNKLARKQGYSSFAELNRTVTLDELAGDE